MNELLKTAVSLSISGSLLILLLFLCRPLLKNRFSRRWQYYIWLAVIARLLLPVSPEVSPVGALFRTGPPAAPSAVTVPQDPAPVPPSWLPEGEDGGFTALPQPAPAAPGTSPDAPEIRLTEYTGILWLGIACLLLVRKITAYQAFSRYIIRGSRAVSDPGILDRLARAGEEAGQRRPVELYVNPMAASPMLLGFFRPCIVLPSADLPESDLRCTLLHELTHCRRWDLPYKWLVQLTLCLHWFNPLVWLMGRETSRACELSCDEAVLSLLRPQERRAYGDTLLRAMEAYGGYEKSPAPVMLNEGGALLKERLDAIMQFKQKSKWITALSLALAVALTAGAGLAGAYTGPAGEGTPEIPEAPENQPFEGYSYAGTLFTYNGQAHDLADRGVTSILSCVPAGKYLVIEGHCNPDHGLYAVFNRETGVIEREIYGANLIWRDSDITTAVYSFWSDIYDYNGNHLGTCEMGEYDYIYRLSFTGDQVSALVITPEMEEKTFFFPVSSRRSGSADSETARFRYTQDGYYAPPYLFEIGYNLQDTAPYEDTPLTLADGSVMTVFLTEDYANTLRSSRQPGLYAPSVTEALAALLPRLAEEAENTAFPLTHPLIASVRYVGNTAPAALAEQFYREAALPQFGAVFGLLEEGEQRALLNKIYDSANTAFFATALEKLPEKSPLFSEFAERAYQNGPVSFFAILANGHMSRNTLESWLARTQADGQTSFHSVALSALKNTERGDAMTEELRVQEYQAWGITNSRERYYYRNQTVRVFLDVRQDGSFQALEVNPQGTADVKVTRDSGGFIQKVEYLSTAEAESLLADMADGSPDNGDLDEIPGGDPAERPKEAQDKSSVFLYDENNNTLSFRYPRIQGGAVIRLGEFDLSYGDLIQYDISAEAGKSLQVGFSKPGDETLDPVYFSVWDRGQEGPPRCTADFPFDSSSPVRPGRYSLFIRAPEGDLENVTGRISLGPGGAVGVVRLDRENLPQAVNAAMGDCSIRTWYLIRQGGRQYVWYNGFASEYSFRPVRTEGGWKIDIFKFKKTGAGYLLLEVPDESPVTVVCDGEPAALTVLE